MKFTTLYEELKFSDVFKVCDNDELKSRRKQYEDNFLKYKVDEAKKTKLSDGSWHVHKDFDISHQLFKLDSLEGLNVSIVDGNFDCSWNSLTSLIGSPKEVGGDFTCDWNQLTSLEGSPEKVGGDFSCSSNGSMSSLEGAPKEVGKGFFCYSQVQKHTEEEIRAICDVKGEIHV